MSAAASGSQRRAEQKLLTGITGVWQILRMLTRLSPRSMAVLGLLVLVLFAGWLFWPYLHAVVVRDGAVTTWINVAPSPIAGYTTNPLLPGDRIGADGRLATITDPHSDPTPLARAEGDLSRTRARLAEQSAVVAVLRHALDARASHADEFAATFSKDMEVAVAGATKSVAALRQQLALDKREAARIAALVKAAAMTQRELDVADATVAEREHEIADLEAFLARASARSAAVARGVFLLEDGTDGNSTFQNLSDARVRLVQAEQAQAQLRAELIAAERVTGAARFADTKARSLDILARPGAMIWSLISAPGAAVQPGSPVASWIDCRIMLVDAPVSDVETSLLHIGSAADVVIEGERRARVGTVVLIRGSAGTLGAHDLAAIAKGRRPGIGQVLVKLEPTAADIVSCPIGHAAYVDFPGVGAFDLIRARLRL